MGLFLRKIKGYSLTFSPKSGILEMGLFLRKIKGYSLTFSPKSGILEMGLFLRKIKGYSLTFKSGILEIFAKNDWYLGDGSIFAKNQRL